MTEPSAPTPANRDRAGGSRPLSRWVVAAPAVALLVGVALGALVAGVATEEGDSAQPPEPTPTAPVPGTGSSTAVVVPSACREAADTVAEATDLIRDGVGAIRDFRPEEILDMLNRLEDLDRQAREQAARCSDVEVTELPSDSPSDSSTEG